MSVLFDTSLLHGFLHTRDHAHAAAVRIVGEALDGQHGQVVTTTFVLDEAITLARVRRQPYSAVRHLLGLVGLDPDSDLEAFIRLLDVTREDVAAALPLQERHWERGLSFTDCTTLQVMAREGIEKLATFDGDFSGVVPVLS